MDQEQTPDLVLCDVSGFRAPKLVDDYYSCWVEAYSKVKVSLKYLYSFFKIWVLLSKYIVKEVSFYTKILPTMLKSEIVLNQQNLQMAMFFGRNWSARSS